MSEREQKATQALRLGEQIQALVMGLAKAIRLGLEPDAGPDELAAAVVAQVELDQVCREFGAETLLYFTNLSLMDQSQEALDALEMILWDEHRTRSGRLAAAARLILGESATHH